MEQPLDAVGARAPTAPQPTAGARAHRLGSRCCFDIVPKPLHCACPLASGAAPPDPLFCGWFHDGDTGRKEFRVLEPTPLATHSFHDADLSQFQKTRSRMIANRDVTYCRLATLLCVRLLARSRSRLELSRLPLTHDYSFPLTPLLDANQVLGLLQHLQ